MNFQIYEEASEWVVKHRNGGLNAGDKQSFDAWLRESPQHVRAYLEMSTVWEDVPALDPNWNPSVEELIARARADDNVVSLASLSLSEGEMFDDRARAEERQGPQQPQGEGHVRGSGTKRLLYTLAASVLMTLAGSWFFLQHGVFSTDTGEQRSLVLADGSTVELNSRSRIKVRYSKDERRIDLLEGQALFRVAKNKNRPFIVQADNTRVRAVGTAFDVYKATSGTVVTVVEGRVAVHSRQRAEGAVSALTQNSGDSPHSPETLGPGTENTNTSTQAHGAATGSVNPPAATGIQVAAGEILLAAGEQLVVTSTASPAPKRTNVASATAWTRRSLVFDSSPLTDVALEFNRYNTRRLVIEDPQLTNFHISGVFSSVEPTLFLRFLHAQPELIVQETETEIRISKK